MKNILSVEKIEKYYGNKSNLTKVLDFAPNDETHPAFGQALRQAAKAGVQVRAFCCRVTPEEMEIDREIPVIL